MDELTRKSTQYLDEAESLSRRSREAFRTLRMATTELKNRILTDLAADLEKPENMQMILRANAVDLENGKKSALSEALLDRLRLDGKRIAGIAGALREIAAFPDPVGEVISGGVLASGVEMLKKRVPLGVVFTVFESRPNVTVDVGALCIKSGNTAILRGGKEAMESNRALHRLFQDAVVKNGIPGEAIQLVEETDRAFMLALLQQDRWIDLVVPRGGEALIQFVSSNTRIPVVKHDKGVCNLYVDRLADAKIALDVAVNAKLQRPSVCNAIENLVIHKDFPGTAALLSGLKEAGADLLGCERTRAIFPGAKPIEDPAKEYSTEYLDNRLSVKIVERIEEAIEFIQTYSSGHSEAIISDSRPDIDCFLRSLDSAALMVNCSTRFHDGGQMGMGAEVGISTGRLHVRGPMGIRDLTTTTYILTGEGQIRK